MSFYLDANVLVALFFPDDPLGNRAYELARTDPAALIVSDFAAAEFASVVSRQVRMGRTSTAEARQAFTDFDQWLAIAERVQMTVADVQMAEGFLRQLTLNLRTPDALHLAITQRLRAEFATFDKSLAASARRLKISVVSG